MGRRRGLAEHSLPRAAQQNRPPPYLVPIDRPFTWLWGATRFSAGLIWRRGSCSGVVRVLGSSARMRADKRRHHGKVLAGSDW